MSSIEIIKTSSDATNQKTSSSEDIQQGENMTTPITRSPSLQDLQAEKSIELNMATQTEAAQAKEAALKPKLSFTEKYFDPRKEHGTDLKGDWRGVAAIAGIVLAATAFLDQYGVKIKPFQRNIIVATGALLVTSGATRKIGYIGLIPIIVGAGIAYQMRSNFYGRRITAV